MGKFHRTSKKEFISPRLMGEIKIVIIE